MTKQKSGAILYSQYKTRQNDVVRKRGDTMPEEAKQALENLSKSADKLTPEQLRRLGDIAYGMSLVKEAQPKKEEV